MTLLVKILQAISEMTSYRVFYLKENLNVDIPESLSFATVNVRILRPFLS